MTLSLRGALFAALLVGPAHARDVDVDGQVALRGYLSADDAGYDPVAITFLETDADVRGLTEGGLRLVLDATFILDATESTERRFGETEGIAQVRQLNVVQPGVFGRLDLTVGRSLLADAGNAWVDGLVARFHLLPEQASVGVYGGLGPDPYDRSLDADYQALGVFGAFRRAGIDANAAYNVVLNEGALDRHFLFNRVHWRLRPNLFVASYLVLDCTTRPELTTLLATVDYTPTPAVNLTLNLSRYSVEQYRNQQVYRNVIEPNQALILGDEVIDLVYERARFSGSLRLTGSLFHYQSVEVKHRSQDDRSGFHYVVGIRDDDLFGWGTRADLQARFVNNYQSDSYLLAADVRHDLSAAWSLGLRATWFDGRTVGRTTERGRTFDEAQSIVLIGGGASWRVRTNQHFDVDYDGVFEAELQDQRNAENLFIHTGMLRYSWLY
jgi:hypothetical protein